MLLATLPARYARLIGTDWSTVVDTQPDGQATYVPLGLRVVESLLRRRFDADDIAVCYVDQIDQFVGERTRVIGIPRTTRSASRSPPTSMRTSPASPPNRSTQPNSVASSCTRRCTNGGRAFD